MKIQRQHSKECALATVAMLADIPLDDVYEYACHLADITNWDQLAYDPGRFWSVLAHVALDAGLPLKFVNEWTIPRLRDAEDARFGVHECPTESGSPNLTGKGILRIKLAISSHVVAYEDGLVYDSNLSYPATFGLWLRKAEQLYGPISSIKVLTIDGEYK